MEGEGRERARAAFRHCRASGLGEAPGSPVARSVRQKEGAESLRTDWPRNRLGGGRGRGKQREGGRTRSGRRETLVDGTGRWIDRKAGTERIRSGARVLRARTCTWPCRCTSHKQARARAQACRHARTHTYRRSLSVSVSLSLCLSVSVSLEAEAIMWPKVTVVLPVAAGAQTRRRPTSRLTADKITRWN